MGDDIAMLSLAGSEAFGVLTERKVAISSQDHGIVGTEDGGHQEVFAMLQQVMNAPSGGEGRRG